MSSGKKSLLNFRRPDVLHFHWLHPYVRPWWVVLVTVPAVILQSFRVRARNGSVVWTIHNEQAHENKGLRLEWLAGRLMSKLASAVIVHNETAAAVAVRRFHVHPSKLRRVPHGHYIDWYPNDVGMGAARKALDLPGEAMIFAFVGSIRRYKGIEELVKAFAEIRDPEAHLLIAGQCDDPGLEDFLLEASRSDLRVHIHIGYVAKSEMQVYLNASDAVVLPYRRVLTSGAVLMAMSFGRACILPKHPGLKDMVPEGGALFYDPMVQKGLNGAMQQAIARRSELSRMGLLNLRTASADHDWGRIVRLTLDAYGKTQSQDCG